MTIALIAVVALFAVFIAVEVVLRLVARCELARFSTLSPPAQRKYQESLHKLQSYSKFLMKPLASPQSALPLINLCKKMQ